jgi:hypothetical protein
VHDRHEHVLARSKGFRPHDARRTDDATEESSDDPRQPTVGRRNRADLHAWDEPLGAKDLDAAMALYQPDATLESPLVRHLLGSEEGPGSTPNRPTRASRWTSSR